PVAPRPGHRPDPATTHRPATTPTRPPPRQDVKHPLGASRHCLCSCGTRSRPRGTKDPDRVGATGVLTDTVADTRAPDTPSSGN
ncbi:hypothetical protein, partial [Actinomyces sp.]|uniref:hypothetical protein n=1 Tax=Actinomyces sp. TaxID=29317 RepID=UPI00289B47DB